MSNSNKLEAQRTGNEILNFCLEQQGIDQEFLSNNKEEKEFPKYYQVVSGRDDALQQIIEFILGEEEDMTEHL